MRRIGIAAIAGFAVWVLAGLLVFVFPDTGRLPMHADVAFVLGGDTPQRVALAERLLANGTVKQMLWSTPDTQYDDVMLRVQHDCATLAHLTCFDPSPSTTQGEARGLAAAAAEHGWTSAIVITQSAHIDRARLIIGRCFAGAVAMAASGEPPQHGWAFQYLYQTAATLKAWIRPGC